MPSHPLHNLVQSIHIDHSSLDNPTRFILISRVEVGAWHLTLFGESGEQLRCWRMSYDVKALPGKEDDLVRAINGGFLHIELHGEHRLSEMDPVDLQFHAPGTEHVTEELDAVEGSDVPYNLLFDATLQLLSRPTGGGDKSELRGLRAEIFQKDAEILHLNAKLQSAKATVARATASNSKKMPVSPSKKAPANASGLQPNQKRRKALEDEFAGSSDESDAED